MGFRQQYSDWASESSSNLVDLLVDERHLALLGRCRSPVAMLSGGRFVFVNDALCALFEVSRETFLKKSVDEVISSSALAQLHSWMISLAQHPAEELVLDLQMSIPDAAPRWLNATFSATRFKESSAVMMFAADIEEHKNRRAMEAQLQQSQKMEAVGRLAGGMAHDMNNTLGAIMGFASVVMTELGPDSHLQSDLLQILRACDKGRVLMSNLLGFARKGRYRRERFSMDKVVDEVVSLLKHSVPKQIEIVTRTSRCSQMVFGDPTQIHQALLNVCLNSLDAMGHRGRLTIAVDTAQLDGNRPLPEPLANLDEGTYVKVVITDTGEGMSEEVLGMVFEPFFTTKPIGEGTGLGLPMVYGTLRNHGGGVFVESRLGEGTSVTMMFPAETGVAGQATSTQTERRTPSNAATATILLVDDEEMVRMAAKRVLEKLGYKVVLASDGAEGVRQFSLCHEKLAAVVLDLMMPVMDGEETFHHLRTISPEVPILLSSGFSKEEKAVGLLAMGADGFIQKPFDMKTLKNALDSLINPD